MKSFLEKIINQYNKKINRKSIELQNSFEIKKLEREKQFNEFKNNISKKLLSKIKIIQEELIQLENETAVSDEKDILNKRYINKVLLYDIEKYYQVHNEVFLDKIKNIILDLNISLNRNEILKIKSRKNIKIFNENYKIHFSNIKSYSSKIIKIYNKYLYSPIVINNKKYKFSQKEIDSMFEKIELIMDNFIKKDNIDKFKNLSGILFRMYKNIQNQFHLDRLNNDYDETLLEDFFKNYEKEPKIFKDVFNSIQNNYFDDKKNLTVFTYEENKFLYYFDIFFPYCIYNDNSFEIYTRKLKEYLLNFKKSFITMYEILIRLFDGIKYTEDIEKYFKENLSFFNKNNDNLKYIHPYNFIGIMKIRLYKNDYINMIDKYLHKDFLYNYNISYFSFNEKYYSSNNSKNNILYDNNTLKREEMILDKDEFKYTTREFSNITLESFHNQFKTFIKNCSENYKDAKKFVEYLRATNENKNIRNVFNDTLINWYDHNGVNASFSIDLESNYSSLLDDFFKLSSYQRFNPQDKYYELSSMEIEKIKNENKKFQKMIL